MNILILNWRDIKNPESGGAEVLTHEMAKRWVAWGHAVTHFSARFTLSPRQEVIDGVRFVRGGSTKIRSLHIPVHLAAFIWYMGVGHNRFDVIVDEIHGIPFFSTLYARSPVVALICEVANDLWDIALDFPSNVIGKFIERNYHHFYKRTSFLTISQSTRDELSTIGIALSRVTILPMGITVPSPKKISPKERHPTLIYVGRLTRAKGVEDAITVISLVKRTIPDIRLWIVGGGEASYLAKLGDIVNKEGLTNTVRIWGFVDENTKFSLMSRAHVLIAPSYKEGWGLTVLEAGWVGTPSVTYDVAGFRDILKDQGGGILVDNNPESMSSQIISLLKEIGGARYKRLQREAVANAKRFDWNKTARTALAVLSSNVKSRV